MRVDCVLQEISSAMSYWQHTLQCTHCQIEHDQELAAMVTTGFQTVTSMIKSCYAYELDVHGNSKPDELLSNAPRSPQSPSGEMSVWPSGMEPQMFDPFEYSSDENFSMLPEDSLSSNSTDGSTSGLSCQLGTYCLTEQDYELVASTLLSQNSSRLLTMLRSFRSRIDGSITPITSENHLAQLMMVTEMDIKSLLRQFRHKVTQI